MSPNCATKASPLKPKRRSGKNPIHLKNYARQRLQPVSAVCLGNAAKAALPLCFQELFKFFIALQRFAG
jgi:hypothetical protein